MFSKTLPKVNLSLMLKKVNVFFNLLVYKKVYFFQWVTFLWNFRYELFLSFTSYLDYRFLIKTIQISMLDYLENYELKLILIFYTF